MSNAPGVIGLPPRFQERVDELRAVDTECAHFNRLAQPYIQAADWEQESGLGIASAVGINEAIDMQIAATALSGYAVRCAGCQSGDSADCRLAGIERIRPLNLVNLLTEDE